MRRWCRSLPSPSRTILLKSPVQLNYQHTNNKTNYYPVTRNPIIKPIPKNFVQSNKSVLNQLSPPSKDSKRYPSDIHNSPSSHRSVPRFVQILDTS
jgi:hypothetical protein